MILKTCMQFTLKSVEINKLEGNIISWVQEYEKYVTEINWRGTIFLKNVWQNILPIWREEIIDMYSDNPWFTPHLQQHSLLGASMDNLDIWMEW